MKFPESKLAHTLLDGLKGVEIGGSAHNAFGLDTINVDYTDDMNTVYKLAEVELCGEAMPVDVVSRGDQLPFKAGQFDFVVSSHVIEHFFDPILALREWVRVSKAWVFVICPQPTALPSDRDKPITPLDELWARHLVDREPEIDTHEHYTRWTYTTFWEMCESAGLEIFMGQNPDDKVGNGFTVVIDVFKTKQKKRWKKQRFDLIPPHLRY